ncbi:MAG: preprotein translocase subunit SecA [Candidatus Portnoybacteria bacterium CG23_combo_of_CG06-09_8_20_14_all_37_13]|uniref:Protein translocase subunit SecA n=1 Tax=Candidatus Portnoybacteria bacterium CG23_combo_of_CG06-09_8_20_14_all_37_13 TaxID=1974819 RepID=A0A2G9YEN9_9BACT|nr:MAG: preprotein translocase subunit SecA [Candidatus Portnoybacteria bacterium CG23_combo_of_CG06-09_8_20_14_all_37_13]
MLKKLFGDANSRYIKKLEPIIKEINKLEPEFERFSDSDFAKAIKKFQAVSSEFLLPQAFALVREAAKRTINQRPFDVQMMAGIVLHRGEIAEMKTGEGKTLAAVMPAYLNALSNKGVHIITVNDYLARRDANWMGPIYHLLGLSVACLNHEQAFKFEPQTKPDQDETSIEYENLKKISRREAYQCNVLYGTNNEFGFDYLRDNMAQSAEQTVQRDLDYAIIDEVDSILIDEARTPLIISAPDAESTQLYDQFAKLAERLDSQDYQIDEKHKTVVLTAVGTEKIIKMLGFDLWQQSNIKYSHHLEQALRAMALFKADKDYVIKDGEAIIVDEFTGRLMPGRRYSGGLHQAIEAKEGVVVQQESRTLATITFQNYFRLYQKLAGMTGTAATSAEEFDKVYSLDVVVIPTNKPMIRQDLEDIIYKTEQGKFKAIITEIQKRYKNGQPILVGTVSIEKNEKLSQLLKKENILHRVLNAKYHEQEAQIIAKAGEKGAVTVATNMAGRGVDIKLGQGVKELGGLHVIGTERHEARRIDNQLRGRAGRQGDSGSSQFFVSLEDDLMRIFGPKLKAVFPEDEPIKHKFISQAIARSQAQLEGYNFDLRKHLLEYDDVLNKQRSTIYKMRRQEKNILKRRIIDLLWMEHLETMDYLRDSVRLRAYGQQDPLIEYKKEGYKLFQDLLNNIEIQTKSVKKQIKQIEHEIKFKGVGRNDPCPCGSGKKYKKCCLNKK